MSGYSDEELSGLTDEEREALKEDDGSGDATTLGEILKENEDKGGADDGAKTGAEGEAAKTDDGTTTAAAASAGKEGTEGKEASAAVVEADAGAAKQDEPVVPKLAPAPLLIAEAPADADVKLKEIADKKNALIEQWDNGDITAKEYQSGLDDLNKQERTLERAIDKASTATEMRQQQEMNSWLAEVNAFTGADQHPEYGQSRARWQALDMYVREIGKKPENANLSGPEILRRAHELVVADLGEAKPAAAAKDGDKKDGAPLNGSKVEPPPTLGKMPAAENTDIDDGRWTALDRLADTDPEAHEEKLMKMSDADRDAYLARA